MALNKATLADKTNGATLSGPEITQLKAALNAALDLLNGTVIPAGFTFPKDALPPARLYATTVSEGLDGVDELNFNPALLDGVTAPLQIDRINNKINAFLNSPELQTKITQLAGTGGTGSPSVTVLATATWGGSPQTTDPTPVPIPQNGTLNLFSVTDYVALVGTHTPSGATGTHKWEIAEQPAGGSAHFSGNADPMFQPAVESTGLETIAVGQTTLKYTFTSAGNPYVSFLIVNRPA